MSRTPKIRPASAKSIASYDDCLTLESSPHTRSVTSQIALDADTRAAARQPIVIGSPVLRMKQRRTWRRRRPTRLLDATTWGRPLRWRVGALKQWQLECPEGELGLVSHVEYPRARLVPVANQMRADRRQWQEGRYGKPILSHRYGFHMLCHAAASLFIQYLGWTPKHLQTCRAICSRTSKPITPDMAKIEAAVRAA